MLEKNGPVSNKRGHILLCFKFDAYHYWPGNVEILQTEALFSIPACGLLKDRFITFISMQFPTFINQSTRDKSSI